MSELRTEAQVGDTHVDVDGLAEFRRKVTTAGLGFFLVGLIAPLLVLLLLDPATLERVLIALKVPPSHPVSLSWRVLLEASALAALILFTVRQAPVLKILREVSPTARLISAVLVASLLYGHFLRPPITTFPFCQPHQRDLPTEEERSRLLP